MWLQILSCVLFVACTGQLMEKDKCFMDIDSTKQTLPYNGMEASVITLPNKVCLAFVPAPQQTYNENAEKCGKNFWQGTLITMETDILDTLSHILGPNNTLLHGKYHVQKEPNSCKIISVDNDGVVNVISGPCSERAGIACQYPYHYRCSYEIKALENGQEIKYESFWQNGDADPAVNCAPVTPQPVPCQNAEYEQWGRFSPCSDNCTKFSSRRVKCQDGTMLIAYRNKSCSTDKQICVDDGDETTPESDRTPLISDVTDRTPLISGEAAAVTTKSSPLLITLLSIVMVFVIVAVTVGLVYFLRLRNREDREEAILDQKLSEAQSLESAKTAASSGKESAVMMGKSSAVNVSILSGTSSKVH